MKTPTVLLLVAILVTGTPAGAAPRPSFDRKAWRDDYATLKRDLEHSYSHLAWAASSASGVDLPALDRRTQRALDTARSDADAAAAIVGFVAGFHDGHFASTVTPEPTGASAEPSPRAPDNDANAACAAFGYSPATRVGFSLPFESLDGFSLQSDGLARAFRSGTIVIGERRFGLIRIPRFRPAEYPALCLAAWPALDAIDAVWLRELADRLGAFRTERVDAVLVDVGGNGGGNDLGDWAARLFTSGEVHSAPLLMHAGPLGAKYMDEHGRAVAGSQRCTCSARRRCEARGYAAPGDRSLRAP